MSLAQATSYIATAPKSNRAGTAYWAAAGDVVDKGSLPVPNHLRNAADRRMKHHGIGVGYKLPHDFANHDVEQQYLPDALAGRRYYLPSDQSYERTIGERTASRERRDETCFLLSSERRPASSRPPRENPSCVLRLFFEPPMVVLRRGSCSAQPPSRCQRRASTTRRLPIQRPLRPTR